MFNEKRQQKNDELGHKAFGDIWDNKREKSALFLLLWFMFMLLVIGMVRTNNQIKSNENAVGATMMCTHACCYFCAIDIVDAGITHFIYNHTYRSDDGLKHLQQNGVIVEQLIDNR